MLATGAHRDLIIMRYESIRLLASQWLPPAVVRWLRQGRNSGVRYEGDFVSWEEASSRCTGYAAADILDKVLASTLKVKRGEAAFERDSVPFAHIEYAWPVLAGLMWAAARNGGKLNVLDFGGALGSSYFQNRRFLQSLPEVKWSVVEQPHYVEAGREHIADEQLRFYGTMEACLRDNRPNVILLSSVVQYLGSPTDLIGALHKVGAESLIIDRTPFAESAEDRLVIQHVPASIYSASYPMWIFSRSGFERLLARDWNMVAANLSPEGFVRTRDGFDFSFRGMLLESRR